MTREQTIFRIKKIGYYPYFTKNSTELKYFVDYRGSNGYLVVFSEDDFLFYTDARYIESYRSKIGSDRVKLLSNYYTSPLLVIFEDLKLRKISRIFLDYNFFSYQEMLDLQAELLSLEISVEKLPVETQRIRLVKDAGELETIKKSQEINEKAFAGAIALLKEGVSEMDIATELEYLVKKQGATGMSFSSIVVFGENSSYPHGVPGHRKLKKGDVVLIDAGVLFENYCSDMTRTLCFGEPEDKTFRKNYQILLQVQKDCLNKIHEMKIYAELDAFVRDSLREQDLEKYFVHSLGHGVGIEIHEIPRIFYQKTEETLQPGHVFTIEPGIYLEGQYGIRIEDMVYLKKDRSPLILSEFPKELIII